MGELGIQSVSLLLSFFLVYLSVVDEEEQT